MASYNTVLTGTKFDGIFKNFELISAIPRESGKEQAVSDFVVDWAKAQGLEVSRDEYLNIVIKKPASAGFEGKAPVLLQAHLDMVCEKNAQSAHDFDTDPIKLEVEGDWIYSATGTSLGADDGIGVACCMAILEDDGLQHPPLEVALTVEEETSFLGAKTISADAFEAMRMINLDHCVGGELVAGSCGGSGVHFTMPLGRAMDEAANWPLYRVNLKGMRGGHSGDDINKGRGNAIVLLARAINCEGVRLVEMNGGSNRVAIPREASAVVRVRDEEVFMARVAEMNRAFAREYLATSDAILLSAGKTDAYGHIPAPLSFEDNKKVLSLVLIFPNGVMHMSNEFEGGVESSNNLGIIKIDESGLFIESELRSMRASTVEATKEQLVLLADVSGAAIEFFDEYVPWQYEPVSPLRNLAVDIYKKYFGRDMKVLAVHAGLECGMFVEKHPGMDIIAIGPDEVACHSPNEKLGIQSTKDFYELVTDMLARME